MQRGSDFCERLGIQHPIIQAPLGGVGSVELVAAVSNSGALGMLGAAYLTPGQITESIEAIRERSEGAFGVNLFCAGDAPAEWPDPAPMLNLLRPYHAELGLPEPEAPAAIADTFDAQLDAVLAAGVSIVGFTFGVPTPETMARLKRHDALVMATATTVEEARLLEAAGIDVIVAQGSEAGGQRGTFSGTFEAGLIGTMALVPQVVDAVSVPVVAAGGIMDGRGIVAALALGAAAAQLGTAFLACREAVIPEAYRQAVRDADGSDTALTRAFSGRMARGVLNEFMRDLANREEAILPYPLQNALTRPMRNAAAARDDGRFLSLWAGQGVGLTRDLPAAELMETLVAEMAATVDRLGRTA
jgi:nitronate monooxygenase